MSAYHASICWQRDGQDFMDNCYSRLHQWQFDGGITLRASSAKYAVGVAPTLSIGQAIPSDRTRCPASLICASSPAALSSCAISEDFLLSRTAS
ncbi:hypothetical protein [Pectobacterium araliae]|uniref:hypothetical protein n=1 Tax=Pectobacterium araliae TaxID=3073862 RepID=UPI0021C34266